MKISELSLGEIEGNKDRIKFLQNNRNLINKYNDIRKILYSDPVAKHETYSHLYMIGYIDGIMGRGYCK